jgi:pimeloyl-ACP methyl ester carboxylesterase
VPVVVVHGAMDRSVTFGRTARAMSGRAVVRYDRRGYARSRGLGVGDLDDNVDDLSAVLGGQPSVVLGHSVGGVIALVAASRGLPEILGVVAYEPPTPWVDWWPRPEEDGPGSDPADEAEAFMRRMVGDRMWSRLPRSTREERRSEGGALRADIAAVATAAPPFDAASVRVPVLVVAGSETSWYHRRGAEELAAALPRGELALVEGAGHGAHLTHPGDLARLVGRFADQRR